MEESSIIPKPWPPAPYDIAADHFRTWNAWYVGNLDELTDIYGNSTATRAKITSRGMTEDHEKFFWGRPNDADTARRHVPKPSNLARKSSTLLFSEPPRISLSEKDEDDKALAERLDKIFGARGFGKKLAAAGELASVLGGVYLYPWWDKSVTDHVVASYMTYDVAVPEWRHDHLVAVTFWSVLSEPGVTPTLRYLERHEKGKITHRVYQGDSSNLGDPLPVADHPMTSWIKNKSGVIKTGLDRMHVVHIRNAVPNRENRLTPQLANLGRSDFEGLCGLFDAYDEAYTSLMRDVQDAKSRLFASPDILDDLGPGKGQRFDPDKHLYHSMGSGLGSLKDGGGDPLIDIKFDIRVEEHKAVLEFVDEALYEGVGLSDPQTKNGALGQRTATEIDSMAAISESTRKAKINEWQPGLIDFVSIVMELDAIHFKTGLAMTEPPEVQFQAKSHIDEAEQSQAHATKVGAGLMSRKRSLREQNPDWTEKEIDAEYDEIMEDMRLQAEIEYGAGSEEPEEEPMEGTGELVPDLAGMGGELDG